MVFLTPDIRSGHLIPPDVWLLWEKAKGLPGAGALSGTP